MVSKSSLVVTIQGLGAKPLPPSSTGVIEPLHGTAPRACNVAYHHIHNVRCVAGGTLPARPLTRSMCGRPLSLHTAGSFVPVGDVPTSFDGVASSLNDISSFYDALGTRTVTPNHAADGHTHAACPASACTAPVPDRHGGSGHQAHEVNNERYVMCNAIT